MKAESEANSAAGKTDRRIVRTRDTLGDALIELMRKRPFEQITVQQVLDRAGVGRTTFYTHYRNKDDLFLSDVEDFCEAMASLLTRHGVAPVRVAPVQELFAHMKDFRDLRDAIVCAGKADDVREVGVKFFARSIEQRLLTAGVTMGPVELGAASHVFAGGLFALLDWWIGDGMRVAPEDMDALFHRTLWDGFALPN